VLEYFPKFAWMKMSTFYNLVAGALLLGGSILHAQDATSSTYCEFTGSFSGLCSSDVIQMTAPVVNSSSGTASFSFNVSSGIYDDVNYVVPKIEVIASNSKFLDSSIFLDDPKSGVSKFIVEKVVLQSPTKSAVFTFSSDNRSPYYIFYRLISKSGDFWQSTPWKIYQNGGIPVSICLHDVCGDERLSIKVADNAYINRLSISNDSLSSYDLISDDKTITLSTFSCKDDAVSAEVELNSGTTSCYADGNRKVFLDISNSEDHLSKISTKTTSNFGIPAFGAGILYNVLKDKSLVAAVIDQGASIDNLKDLAADMYLRYDKLASLSDILGASRTDGLGIAGRNKGWLYPRFIVKNVADNPSAIYPGVAKKITVAYYYDGSLVNASNAALVGRDVFVAGVNTTGGYRLAFLSDDWNLHAINKADFGITTSSDTFVNLQKNGFWAMLDAATKVNGAGSILIDGHISVHGGSDVSSFLVEDVTYRQGKYERISGTEKDPLYFGKMTDTLYIHAGASKRLSFNVMHKPTTISLVRQDSLKKITSSSFVLSGNRLTLSLDSSAKRNYSFSSLLKVIDSADTVLVPLQGRTLRGVQYVMVGTDINRATYTIKFAYLNAIKMMEKKIDSGYEPHLLSAQKQSDGLRPLTPHKPYFEPDSHYVSSSITYDVWGVNGATFIRCLNGAPYNSSGKRDSLCGTAMDAYPSGIRGMIYFGHGNNSSIMLGMVAARNKEYKSYDDCNHSDDKGKTPGCWSPTQDGLMTLGSDCEIAATLFDSLAAFTAYACETAKPVFYGESFIEKASKLWRIPTYGDTQYLHSRCLNADIRKCMDDAKYVRYFSANPERDFSKKNILKAYEEYIGRFLFSKDKPGELKAGEWKNVKMTKCTYKGGAIVCDYDNYSIPDDMSPVEAR